MAMLEQYRSHEWPEIRALIERVIDDVTPTVSPLREMCQYQLDTGGKRFRALLPLVVAEALGHPRELVRPLGAACEMLHNASLVKDDIEDGDDVRRGQDTVWRRYGVPRAINASDAMIFYALRLVEEIEAPLPTREALRHQLVGHILRVIHGQELELDLRRRARSSLADYFEVVEHKTAGLFALPLVGAAVLCAAPAALVEGLEAMARELGVLFQIQDDVLDLWGDKGRRERGCDIAEGKRSVLVVHALQHASHEQSRWLLEVLDKPRAVTTADDVGRAAALFETLGSLRFALDEIATRRARALAVLEVVAHAELHALMAAVTATLLLPIEAITSTAGSRR